MNSLFGLAALPAAGAAANAFNGATSAMTRPFGKFFQEAVEQSDPTADAESDALMAEANSLQDRLARQLQALLTSLGVAADEEASIRFDQTTGQVMVDGHHASSAIQSAIQSDPQMLADMQRLAELHSQFDPNVSTEQWELQARVMENERSALLRWR